MLATETGKRRIDAMFSAIQLQLNYCLVDPHSGGPLIQFPAVLVGVVSWGDGCARAGMFDACHSLTLSVFAHNVCHNVT